MNTADDHQDTPTTATVFAAVSGWEYGCCGTTPKVGATMSGTLRAASADDQDDPRFIAPAADDWDPRSRLVRFGPVSAGWAEESDRRGRRLSLYLSWHDASMPAPTVDGEVVELYSVSEKYRLTGHTRHSLPGSTEDTKVTEVPRFDVDNSSTGDCRNNGVVVGLRVSAVEEPTLEETAEYLRQQEKLGRTIHLTGPAEVFGESVPPEGSRLTVDLSDPRLELDGPGSHLRTVVSGIAVQVSLAEEFDFGFTVYGDVQLGSRAAETGRLFIRLEMDPEIPG